MWTAQAPWGKRAAAALVLLLVFLAGSAVQSARDVGGLVQQLEGQARADRERLAAEQQAALDALRAEQRAELERISRENAAGQRALQQLALRLLAADTAAERQAAVEQFNRDSQPRPTPAARPAPAPRPRPSPTPTQPPPRPSPTPTPSPTLPGPVGGLPCLLPQLCPTDVG